MIKKFRLISGLLAVCMSSITYFNNISLAQDNDVTYSDLFGKKELLSYFLITDDLKMQGDLEDFIFDLNVSEDQLSLLYTIAQQERENASLYSKNLISDEELSERYSDIDISLQNIFDDYNAYKEWITKWYLDDINYRNDFNDFIGMQDTRSGVNRRYYVFATQFSHTSQGVALPDKYIKFANLGWHSDIPENVRQYYYDTPYTVNLYNPSNDKTVLNALVVDSGPWNIDDSYWNPAYERRMFADLAQGMPEAQAAYENGYNSGKDQYGRTVLNPAGIDLTSSMSAQLGMGSSNAWIYVRFDNLP